MAVLLTRMIETRNPGRSNADRMARRPIAVQSFLGLALRGTNDEAAPVGGATLRENSKEESPMLYTIAIILLILWALGFFAFHVAGGLIHLLIVVAVVMILINLLSGRRAL